MLVSNKHLNIKAKGRPDYTSLYQHLLDVSISVDKFSKYLNLDSEIARCGAILHDIGKVSPIFQERLQPNYNYSMNDEPYRHEISSLFFLSLFDEEIHPFLIEMILSHHKSLINDIRGKGFIDLFNDYGYEEVFDLHIIGFKDWMPIAVEILGEFGVPMKPISVEDAFNSYKKVVEYCHRKLISDEGYSEWRGLLMGSDYLASALLDKTVKRVERMFKKPNLSYYHSRKHELYPLSLKKSDSIKKHTIVTACTGAGKTDFLMRRCKGRVFYTLPFTASINAMYRRIKSDLRNGNRNADIRVLHSTSKMQVYGGKKELKVIQPLFGSSVKVLTPHQIASIVFGINGYESILLDLKGCDVILDEIHTYGSNIQAIVLKIVEMLNNIGCNIHIGTATLPTTLYKKILDILGEKNVYQVKLTKKELQSFNRHKIYKLDSYNDIVFNKITTTLNNDEKVLVVRNRIELAQETYSMLKRKYKGIPIILLHSRYKKKQRNALEKKLMKLNKSNEPCIVVSTQVVEVSIDISFDFMVTDCAPIDSLIQRFGRINRKRSKDTIGKYKPIFVIRPPEAKEDSRPYNLDIVKKTFDVLPDSKILKEFEIQKKIDEVYPKLNLVNINQLCIFDGEKYNGIYKLQNKPKSILLNELDIMSVSCILDSDVNKYLASNSDDKSMLELQIPFYLAENLNLKQLDGCNRKPFIITKKAYSNDVGLDLNKLRIFGNEITNYEII